MYSQSQEEKYIVEYFKGFTGTLISIGENDGRTFSNALRLIELGWFALLIEPSPRAYKKLKNLHRENCSVVCRNIAVSDLDGVMTFHESGSHLPDRSDDALLSTLVEKEKERWATVEYNPVSVNVYSWDSVIKQSPFPDTFDFITIDAEGMDLIILKQIDLTHTQLLCIEWNSLPETKKEILNYTSQFNMNKIIYQSAENLLICR